MNTKNSLEFCIGTVALSGTTVPVVCVFGNIVAGKSSFGVYRVIERNNGEAEVSGTDTKKQTYLLWPDNV